MFEVSPSSADRPATTPSSDGAWARALADRQVLLLGDLAEAGMDVVALLQRDLEAAVSLSEAAADAAQAALARGEPLPANGGLPPPRRAADLALAICRVSRAVRLTLVLQRRLAEDILLGPRLPAPPRRDPADSAAAAASRQARGAPIQPLETQAAEADAEDAESPEPLATEAPVPPRERERLDEHEVWGDLLHRPLAEVVALICRDLGLSAEYSRWITEACSPEAGAPGPEVAAPVHGMPVFTGSRFTRETRAASPSVVRESLADPTHLDSTTACRTAGLPLGP